MRSALLLFLREKSEDSSSASLTELVKEVKKVKQRITVNGYSISQLRDVSDHIVLPATRYKWTRPALTPASKLVLDLPTPEGWKAELT